PALPRPRRLLQVQQTARLVTAAVSICQFPVRFTVSALLTVYNRAHILKEAVHSLLNSGDRDLEIVLVDDCSPDASWPLCQTLAGASPLVHAFRNDKNLGD
ncbi:MAG: glycosyltransferase family 2 protein, partial [Planctomyces sp.]